MRWFSLLVMFLVGVLVIRFAHPATADDKTKKEPEAGKKKEGKESFLLIVPPTGGKEVKLVDWKFTLGTRRFDPKGGSGVDPAGLEYLEFREDKSTTYDKGILTLAPLASIRKIDYDREKKTVAVVVVTSGDKTDALTGSTKYIAINKITLEAEVQLEDLGNATVKFQGGGEKGLRSITFPAPKPMEEPNGTPTTIIAVDKDKTKHVAYDLQALYSVVDSKNQKGSKGFTRVLPYLTFKKTVKVDMSKIAALRFVPSQDKKKISHDFEVTLKDGNKHTLTLLETSDLDVKKTAIFLGFIGRVPVGYKLFPAHTIQELQVGEAKKD